MLTPVTPNPIANATTIKSHGSESRTASGHNTVEAPTVPQASIHTLAIGLDAGSILANVNAEAATAGNRTILQTLALAVAAQLNIVRRNDETMEAFFLRIAATLDEMTPDEQAATEARTGLKMLKIQLPELSAALKRPDSALAARLSAIAEAPLATPQKTAAAAATTTYLQEAPGVSRAAETLAMVTQSRTNSEGTGLFSSSPLATPVAQEEVPADARSLQTQLKSLFEPGVAETRIEIAEKIEQPKVLILGAADDLLEPAISPPVPAEEQQVAEAEMPDPARQPAVAMDDGSAEQPAANPANIRQADARQGDVKLLEPKQVEPKQAEPMQAQAGEPEVRQPDAKQLESRQIDARPAEPRQLQANQAAFRQPEQIELKQPEADQAEPKLIEARQKDVEPAGRKLVTLDAAVSARASDEMTRANPGDRRPEPRMLGLPVAQNNNVPSASMRIRAIARELVQEKLRATPAEFDRGAAVKDADDHRMQTLLTLRGIAEVISAAPAKAAEFLMSPQLVADIQAREQKASGLAEQADAADPRPEFQATKAETTVRKDAATHHAAPVGSPLDAEAEEMRSAAGRSEPGQTTPAERAVEPERFAALVKAPASGLDPVPFAYAALQPVKEEFKADAPEERARHEGEEDDGADQEREDEDTRRERLARKATDDLLRPEPETDTDLKITRDSSQADRAYALYQRMAGF